MLNGLGVSALELSTVDEKIKGFDDSVREPYRVGAAEMIRRLRGGSQPMLMRCRDSEYYVVKFKNNPQGLRVLFNDFLGSQLAMALGLPVATPAIIDVTERLIKLTPEMRIEHERGWVPCKAGTCFGSRYSNFARVKANFPSLYHDFIGRGQYKNLQNFHDFLGMLVFDKWTGNTDNRQVVFFRSDPQLPFSVSMIDQGMCFHGDSWSFPDHPRKSLYAMKEVYEKVTGLENFEPWLNKLENKINGDLIMKIASQIPTEWYDNNKTALRVLAETLDNRRRSTRLLILKTWKSNLGVFPNWRSSYYFPYRNGESSCLRLSSTAFR